VTENDTIGAKLDSIITELQALNKGLAAHLEAQADLAKYIKARDATWEDQSTQAAVREIQAAAVKAGFLQRDFALALRCLVYLQQHDPGLLERWANGEPEKEQAQ